MNIVDSSVREIKQSDIIKHIEYCGRTAYRSHDLITIESGRRFLNMIESKDHSAVLEFGSVYINYIPHICNGKYDYIIDLLNKNSYSKVTFQVISGKMEYYFYTNMRVLFQNCKELYDCIINNSLPFGFSQFVPIKTDPYYRRTFEVVTNIGVSREGNRHRVNSIIEESTRYVCYMKEKFGSEITFLNSESLFNYSQSYDDLIELQEHCEAVYAGMIKRGEKPQSARLALLLNTKTQICYCASNEDWDHFINLRSDIAAHPQIREMSNEIKKIIYG